MKISVKAERSICLRFPTGLVLNRVTAAMLPKYLREQGIPITADQAVTFVKALNRYRRGHPEWKLVEVKSANGEAVEIKI